MEPLPFFLLSGIRKKLPVADPAGCKKSTMLLSSNPELHPCLSLLTISGRFL